jgi:hypothetical protein
MRPTSWPPLTAHVVIDSRIPLRSLGFSSSHSSEGTPTGASRSQGRLRRSGTGATLRSSSRARCGAGGIYPAGRQNGDVSRRIHAIQWRDDGLVAVKFADGRVAAEADPTELADMLEQFSVVEYQPWHRRLIFKFRDEYGFECDLGRAKDPSPIHGRPVVYLDQNQWSTLSKSLFAPERVSDTERLAAVRLLRMAEAGEVILPLSSAHLSETGAWSNDAGRLELARTILAGSRGWQMRDALAVRADEFRQCLAALAGIDIAAPASVMTLEPYAALDSSVRGESDGVSLPADLPEAWEFGYLSTLSNTVYVACLLDREPTPRGSLAAWLGRVQEFSSWLDGQRQRSKSDRRRAARLFAAADATKEIASAAAEIGATPAGDGVVRSCVGPDESRCPCHHSLPLGDGRQNARWRSLGGERPHGPDVPLHCCRLCRPRGWRTPHDRAVATISPALRYSCAAACQARPSRCRPRRRHTVRH